MATVAESGDNARRRDRFEELLLHDLDHLNDPAPETWRQQLARMEFDSIAVAAARQRREEREREQQRQKVVEDQARLARLGAQLDQQRQQPRVPVQPTTISCNSDDCLLSFYGPHTHETWSAEEAAESDRMFDEFMVEQFGVDFDAWVAGPKDFEPRAGIQEVELPVPEQRVSDVLDPWGPPKLRALPEVVTTVSTMSTGVVIASRSSTVTSATATMCVHAVTAASAIDECQHLSLLVQTPLGQQQVPVIDPDDSRQHLSLLVQTPLGKNPTWGSSNSSMCTTQ